MLTHSVDFHYLGATLKRMCRLTSSCYSTHVRIFFHPPLWLKPQRMTLFWDMSFSLFSEGRTLH